MSSIAVTASATGTGAVTRMNKVCSKCRVLKPHSAYQARPERSVGVRSACKECDQRAFKIKYHLEKGSGKNRDKLWRGTGLKMDMVRYTEKYLSVDGKCEICIKPFKTLCVDHKHSNMELRGLLCTACNLAIANFKDSKENLMNAIKYVEKYGVDYE